LICFACRICGQADPIQSDGTLPQPEASGLACQLLVHPPIRTNMGQKTYIVAPVELVLKNVSSKSIRVTTLCMAWRGTAADSQSILFNETFKSDSLSYDEKSRKVVTLLPGQTTSVTDQCIPQKNLFRLSVAYSIGTECGQKLKVWHGDIAAPAVMVQIEPFKTWPVGK
jgi:hypothetical protein